jgi:isoamylase
MELMRSYPTDYTNEYNIGPGNPMLMGATIVPGGINFSVSSLHATECVLVLYGKGEDYPFAEITFPPEYRIGKVFTMVIADLDYRQIEYCYRMNGPYDAEKGQRFNFDELLLDPYAKLISGRNVWGHLPNLDQKPQFRARIAHSDFDWEGDHSLQNPLEDLVIYEMHVRGFTQHWSSGVWHPGTFDGVREKIPYLKALGINCIELLPVFEFDEFENWRKDPETGTLLLNYWGYSSVGFFAPKANYAQSDDAINEFKELVKELHRNGIEVILDVVYNHTAEGNERGPVLSFKGIDNPSYYILTQNGYYYNFSGTGNTFNCNHPAAQAVILDSLRYWASEFHVDGFRFDLASILTRDENGMPMQDPPLVKAIARDPILANCKLIAEPWDADGLYHVGSFPHYGRWSEWNGRYRDTLRKFLKGDRGQIKELAARLIGSLDMYHGRTSGASVNFITAHDGFTLADLVSYNEKQNSANLEDNRDGANDNHSWNHGVEGETDDQEILSLRRRQMKNALAMLLVSQGVPMFLMGDEIGRTQQGNNNPYCQDCEISWMDWSLLETNADLFNFVQQMIAFRKAHPALRRLSGVLNVPHDSKAASDVTWHGIHAGKPEWAEGPPRLAFMLRGDRVQDQHIYVAMNMDYRDQIFELPRLAQPLKWHVFANTGAEYEIHATGHEQLLDDQRRLPMINRSVAVLVAK